MKKVLLIRRTKEYYEEGKLGRREHYFVPNFVGPWNLFFGMKYMDFRKRCVKISEESISKSKFDLIIPYEDKAAADALPSGSLVVPMDEDDWISSSLLPEITKVFTGKHLYWDIYRIWWNGQEQGRFSKMKEMNLVRSCGYALATPVEFSMIQYHWALRAVGSQYVPKMLSLKLDTPASISHLRRKNRCQHEGIVKNIYQTLRLEKLVPEEYSSYWDQYIELCQELLSSSRLPYKHIADLPNKPTKDD